MRYQTPRCSLFPQREPGEAGFRYEISPALRAVFVPHRMEILRRFLSTGQPPVHSNGPTIGGGRASQ